MTGQGARRLPGLTGPARVRIDQWGVAHIDASSARDAYLLQGVTAAESRLFQLDLWRRRGLGLVAEAFGPEHVARDVAARHFLYRGDLDAEWAAYGERAREAVEAFVAGINLVVDDVRAGRSPLPPEFGLFEFEPARWSPEDVVRIRLHGLFDNVRSELTRVLTLREFGPEADDLRRVREPYRRVRIADERIPGLAFAGALDVYELATAPLAIGGLPGAPMPTGDTPRVDGSNNWVVAGTRTATGRPIVADDPHRAMSLPSLRTLVHLRCPEFDVIGAGEPMLPGVSIGHNGRVAFGLTIFPTDQEDLYLYELDAEGRYLVGGERLAIEEVEESIPVRGEGPRHATLRFTVHGPVTGMSADGRTAAATRLAWLGPGMAPYLGSLRYQRARTADEFRSALEHWGAPTVNQVFADVDGAIGWQAAGRVPRRSWDGLTPVLGDGRFEWEGMRPFADLPGSDGAERGFIATANQFNLPDLDDADPLSFEWLAPYRHRRIEELLAANDRLTVEDAVRMQGDRLSIPARHVLTVLARERDAVLAAAPEAADLVDILLGWDHVAGPDSIGAGVFEAWFRGPLRRRLRAEAADDLGRAGEEALIAVIDPTRAEELTGDPRVDLELLDRLAEGDVRLVPVLADTLIQTRRDLVAASGPAAGDWALGRRQRTRFRHPAGDRAPASWHVEAVRGGTPDTVDVFARDAAGTQTVGASVRVVMDVGAWDMSRAINAPGQSGVPGSDHYADLVGSWADGGTFPLAYSEAAVDAVTQIEWRAEPAGAAPEGE